MAGDSNKIGFDCNLAVVIGIDNYGNGVPSLNTPANDARELARVLQDEHGYEQVWEFIDPICTDENCQPTATREKLEEFLEKTLPKEVEKNHRLLFYFAGHGIALNGDDGPQGYLIPQDAKLGDATTYLPMPKIERALTELSCRHCLIILDCCFAGAFRWSSTRKLVPIPEVIHKERFERFIHDPAWQVITSASYDQFAWDTLELKDDRGTDPIRKQHSPFAAALIEALSGSADGYPPAKYDKPAGDGVITATELYLYLRGYVEDVTENSIRQTPTLWSLKKHDKGEYIFLAPGHELNLPDAPSLDEVLKDETKNPYRGLQSYEKEHSQLFFGRTKLIEKLCGAVCDLPLTVVLGASGSGKSSLVKAGLVPHLGQAKQPLQKPGQKQKLELEAHPHQHRYQQWQILPPFRPGETPLKALYSALKEKESSLAEYLSDSSELTSQMLNSAIAGWSQQHSGSKPKLLLIVDQFEELVTLCRNEEEQSHFLQVLINILVAHPKQLKIVLTLRSDFEPQLRDSFEIKLQQNQVLAPLLQAQLNNQQNDVQNPEVLSDQQSVEQKPELFWNQARFIVPAMTREELREVIEEPASAKVVFFKPHSLVDQLIDEVAGMPGALPLLSFALSELYLKLARRYFEARQEGKIVERAIIQADYEELGGVARSLTQRADEEYRALVKQDPAYEQTIQQVMSRMVAEGGELARRQAPLSELEYPEPENTRVKTVIQCFSDVRLLTGGTNSEGQPYVEPAHDALVRGWQKLQDWKQKNLVSMLLQRDLTLEASQWASSSNKRSSRGLLWDDDPRLPLAMKLLCGSTYKDTWLNFLKWMRGDKFWKSQSNNYWLNSIEAKFVTDSFDQKYIKRRNTVVITFSVLVSIVGFALLALQNANTAEKRAINADIRTWSLSAKNYLNPEQQLEATLNAIRAGRLVQDNEARIDSDARIQAITALQAVVYNLKPNQVNFRQRNQLEESSEKASYKARSVAFSKDGVIATAYEDGSIKLWQSDGRTLDTSIPSIKAHNGSARSVSFSPDGQSFVSSGDDQMVKLWKLNGRLMRVLGQHNGNIPSVSFSPDGSKIASGGSDGSIKLWTPGGSLIEKIEKAHLPHVQSVEFSPNGTLLASAGDDGTVKLWTPEGKLIKSVQHGNTVLDVSFSRDEKVLASAGEDRKVKLWSRNGKQLGTLTEHNSSVSHSNSVSSVSFSSNGNIATASTDQTVKIWDIKGKHLQKGNLLQRLTADSSEVWDVSFHPHEQILASAGSDGVVKLWSNNQTTFQTVNDTSSRAVSFSPDNQFLAYGTLSGEIKALDIKRNKVVSIQDTETVSSLQSHNFEVSKVKFNINNEKIKINLTEKIDLTDWNKTIILLTWNGEHREILTSKAFDRVELSSGNKETPPSKVPRPAVSGTSFSSDGQLIAIAGKEKSSNVFLGKVEKDHIKLYRTFKGHRDLVEGVSFSPTGSILASASRDRTIRLWLTDDSCSKPLTEHINWFKDVSFSSIGSIVASASRNPSVKTRPEECSCLKRLTKPLTGHTNFVVNLSFHPDPKIKVLASASNDQTVKLWDICTGSEITTLFRGYANKPKFSPYDIVRFSPDGNLLAITGNDNTIILQDFDLSNLLKLACNWSKDYRKTNPTINEDDKKLCQGITDL